MSAAGVPSVPNYNIYGHHHYRLPYKDKSQLLTQDIRHPKWLEPPPEIRSRVELQQARKRGRVPDGSYDFDGDGVVGQLDFFVGRAFDSDNDGRLTRSERGRAEKALENGFLDKYVRGMEATGVYRDSIVRQRRSVICGADNPAEASMSTYPPHHNSNKVPDHGTRTSLKLSRSAELKGFGSALGEKYAAKHAPVPEVQPPTAATEPRRCPVSHICERAEGDHQLARVRAGLLPMSQPGNPERELKTLGLDYVAEPFFATRGQLLETRKELMKRECEDLRAKGDEQCVPMSVRRTQKEANEYEFRRLAGGVEPMTLTRLKDDRKKNKIEYDMANFNFADVYPRAYPKFSDRPDVPFWVSDASAAAASSPPRMMARGVSEPVLKVTDVPFGDDIRDTYDAQTGIAHSDSYAGLAVPGAEARLGSRTVKRWTTDMLERGQGRNKPRIFDNIQPALPGPKDLDHLDLTSSMEPVRAAALRRRAQDRIQAADQPRKSRLWRDPNQGSSAMGSVHFQKPVTAEVTAHAEVPASALAVIQHIAMESTAPPKPHKRTAQSLFGATTKSMGQSMVRCGGFQRFDVTQPQQKTRVIQMAPTEAK